MNPLVFDITAAWRNRVQSPAEIAAAFLRALDAFKAVDPRLTKWGYFDFDNFPHGVSVERVRSSLAQLVEANPARDENDQDAPGHGYMVGATNDYPTISTMSSRTVLFGVHAGAGKWGTNTWQFDIGDMEDPTDLSLVTFPMFKGVLLAALANFPAPWASARCYVLSTEPAEATGDPDFPYSQYQLPWICYLAPDRAAGLAVPPEVIQEATPDGGLLMAATRERLDPTRREHVRASKVIAKIMIARGGDPAI